MTQTKANTTLGFTSQLDLLVKPVPISCLFLTGRVITKASATPELRNLLRMLFGNLLKSPTLVFTIYVPEGLLLLPKPELQTDKIISF